MTSYSMTKPDKVIKFVHYFFCSFPSLKPFKQQLTLFGSFQALPWPWNLTFKITVLMLIYNVCTVLNLIDWLILLLWNLMKQNVSFSSILIVLNITFTPKHKIQTKKKKNVNVTLLVVLIVHENNMSRSHSSWFSPNQVHFWLYNDSD